MADPNSQMAMQHIQWFFQIAGLALDTVQTVSDVISRSLAPLDNDPYIQQLNQTIREGKADINMMVKQPGESIQEFEKRIDDIKSQLKDAGVWCHVQKTGDGYAFITLKDEADRVNSVFNKNAVKDAATMTNTELNTYANGKVLEFKINDEYAAMMMAKRCEKNYIPCKVEAVYDYKTKQTEFKVRFAEADLDKMKAIKRNVVIDMTDPAKDIRKAQLKFEMESSTAILKKVQNLENAGNYIVGANGNVMKVNENNVVFIKGDKSEVVYMGNTDESKAKFNNKVLSEWGKMGRTTGRMTEMTEEQYQQYIQSTNKQDFIVEVERQQGRPELTDTEKEVYKKAEMQRAKVEAKLMQGHPEEIAVDLNDYNNEESIGAFKSSEKIDYEAAHDLGESEQINGTFLDDARAFNNGIIPEEPDVSLDVDELADQIMNADEIEVDQINEQSIDSELEQ